MKPQVDNAIIDKLNGRLGEQLNPVTYSGLQGELWDTLDVEPKTSDIHYPLLRRIWAQLK